jgi:hypothetical protein
MLVGSYHPDWPREPLHFTDSRGRSFAYLQVRDGRAYVFSDPVFEDDGSSGPWIADPRTMLPPNNVRGSGSLVIPGFAFHHCRFNFEMSVWSLGVSLAIPGGFFLALLVFLLRRLRRQRRELREPSTAPAPA